MEFETPDDQVCEEVREYRNRLRAWDAKQRQGAKPVAQQTPTAASIKLAYEQAIASRMNVNGGDRMRAVSYVNRTQPELHRQYLRATNPKAAWPT